MAVIRAASGDVEQSSDHTFSGGTPITGSFDFGTGANRYATLTVEWDGSTAVAVGDAAATIDSVAMTLKAGTTSQGNGRMKSWELHLDDEALAQGVLDWAIDPDAGAGDCPAIVSIHCYENVDATAPSDAAVVANDVDSAAPLVSAVTVSSAADDMVHLAHGARGNGVASGVATGFTERTDNIMDVGTTDIGLLTGNEPGAASVVTSVEWTGPASINWIAHGWNINAAAGGGGGLDIAKAHHHYQRNLNAA